MTLRAEVDRLFSPGRWLYITVHSVTGPCALKTGAGRRKIAETINHRGIETERGGKWAAEQVADILGWNGDLPDSQGAPPLLAKRVQKDERVHVSQMLFGVLP